ncbi:MAG: Hsp70 family protein [Gemmataceae bacterium]
MHASAINGLVELPAAGYIGIDFGTSSTHVAVCFQGERIQAEPIALSGKASAVHTCLLWDNSTTPPTVCAFGDKALQRFCSLKPEERAKYRLAVAFKPDIAGQGQAAMRARQDAEAFLRKCFEAVSKSSAIPAVGDHHVLPTVVGVPAEVIGDHKALTAGIATKAGFSQVSAVDEPLGALAFHLANGSVRPEQARKGLLVVDFGGGTLDIAWMDTQYGLRKPWGDPTLGGRLFDDLFYQWLCEQNPDLRLSPADEAYAWQVSCRDLKERFSMDWAEKDGAPSFHFSDSCLLPGRQYAEFNGSVGDFLRRAAQYSPSKAAREYFQAVGGPIAQFGASGPVDLLGRIRAELVRGYDSSVRVECVILTGGSCAWPFMQPLAQEAFGIHKRQLVMSAQPELTIGQGLAIYNVLRDRNRKRQKELRERLPEHQQRFETAATELRDRWITQTVDSLITPLCDGVEAIYLNWYRNGGTLNAAQEQVRQAIAQMELTGQLQQRYVSLHIDLDRLLEEHLQAWLKESHIERELPSLAPSLTREISLPALEKQAQQIASNLSDLIGLTLAGTIAATVAVVVHGAHIAVSPVSGFAVAGGAFLASLVGYTLVEDFVREQVMAWNWGPNSRTALQAVMSENSLREKIAYSRQAARAQMEQLLRQEVEGMESATTLMKAKVQQFRKIVEQTINELGVLEQFRTGK